jgi:cytidyltransferase-like protein
MSRAAFIGRWSPFHYGHEWLIRQKLDKGIPCLVLVRDTPMDDRNPFAAKEVKEMVEAALEGEDVVVQIIPDIESVNWGRGVGYDTVEHKPPENIKRVSATKIRECIRSGDNSWRDCVNPKSAAWLESYYEQKEQRAGV